MTKLRKRIESPSFFNQERKKEKQAYYDSQPSQPPVHKWVRESKQLLARYDETTALGNKIQIGSEQTKNLQRYAGGLKSGTGAVPHPPKDHCCGHCKVSCCFNYFSRTSLRHYQSGRHHISGVSATFLAFNTTYLVSQCRPFVKKILNNSSL